MILSRRRALQALSVLPAAGFVGAMPRVARAAEFSLKYGNNLPLTHPLNIRAQEAAERIAKETNGRVEITIFPNNQLGGDTDMLAQVQAARTFFTPSALVAATLVPVAAINAVGFAFADYDQVWKAMDGALGAHVRAALAKVGLYTFEKMWDNGFRQITSGAKPIESAKDMDGLKIRVPVSPLSISMFKALSASPTSLQFRRSIRRCKPGSSCAGKPVADHQVAALRGASTAPSATHLGRFRSSPRPGRCPAGRPQDNCRCHQRCRPETA
jgi:TRAP-type C4-dicarboxylate transport system substrate-binding protein